MAIECVAAVINARKAPWKKGNFTVLLMLANYADPDGTNIFPSVDRLRRACRLEERAVQGCLRALLDDGVLIEVEAAPGRRTKEYRICMDRVALFDGCKKCGGVICDDDGCKKQQPGVQKTAAYIDDPSGPVIYPSGARAPWPVDNQGAAPELWNAIAAKIGPEKSKRLMSFKAVPAWREDVLVLSFPKAYALDYVDALGVDLGRVMGCPVVFKAPGRGEMLYGHKPTARGAA